MITLIVLTMMVSQYILFGEIRMTVSELDIYLANKKVSDATHLQLYTYLNDLPLNSTQIKKIIFAAAALLAQKGIPGGVLVRDKEIVFEANTSGDTISYTVVGVGAIITRIFSWNLTQLSNTLVGISADGAYYRYRWTITHGTEGVKEEVTDEAEKPDYPLFLLAGAKIHVKQLTYTTEDEARLCIWGALIG